VLVFDAQGLSADNTDGIGLVRDIEMRLGIALRNASVLLLGAGGAGRGVVGPLLDAGVVRLHIANRSPGRAHELAAQFSAPSGHRITAGDLVKLPDGLDLVINATSSGLGSEHSPIETDELAGAVLAYDMVYGSKPTPFMSAAKNAGVAVISDGLGMLVEQAAESFLIWRGVRPETETVYRRLREEINPHRQNPPT
jgi:shikimate dehydrogenase